MAIRLCLLALTCGVLGCGRGAAPTVGGEVTNSSKTVDPNAVVTATLAATEFVASAKTGTATAALLTEDFKKVIGEPITPSEREKGYSDTAAVDWLKIVGPRLKSSQVRPLKADNAIAMFELEPGTLRMVNVDSKWRVDWFHAGRPNGASAILPDESAKCFAVAAFLDPLFTNNYELSEAALTLDTKKSLAPALGGDARGYNRGTLRGKLKSILIGATGYTVTLTGDKATITLTGPAEKKMTLTLSASARPEIWLVSGLD
jgi:hypothetical protein